MAYEFIEHGRWETYQPTEPLPGKFGTIPLNALFFRRVGDGVDWYIYANTATNWQDGAAVATALPGMTEAQGYLVQAVTWTAREILPGEGIVFEITGIPLGTEKPHKLFEGQIYRSASGGSITPMPPSPVERISAIQGKIQLSRTPDGAGSDLLTKAEEYIASSSERELQVWFTGGGDWLITNPNIQKVAGLFNLEPQQVQALFDAASLIEA